jgi:hypothetical protein
MKQRYENNKELNNNRWLSNKETINPEKLGNKEKVKDTIIALVKPESWTK